MTKRKFTSGFKTKVVLETLKERITLAELAQKHRLQPTQISAWKWEFLDGASDVFDKGKKNKKSESEMKKSNF